MKKITKYTGICLAVCLCALLSTFTLSFAMTLDIAPVADHYHSVNASGDLTNAFVNSEILPTGFLEGQRTAAAFEFAVDAIIPPDTFIQSAILRLTSTATRGGTLNVFGYDADGKGDMVDIIFNSVYQIGTLQLSDFLGPQQIEINLTAFLDNNFVGCESFYAGIVLVAENDDAYAQFISTEGGALPVSSGLDAMTASVGLGPSLSLNFDPNGGPAPTPIPGAIWLLGTGLAGLFSVRKKII